MVNYSEFSDILVFGLVGLFGLAMIYLIFKLLQIIYYNAEKILIGFFVLLFDLLLFSLKIFIIAYTFLLINQMYNIKLNDNLTITNNNDNQLTLHDQSNLKVLIS